MEGRSGRIWRQHADFVRRDLDGAQRSYLDHNVKQLSLVARTDNAIALKMTIGFGSIWCVYACTLFFLVPLLLPNTQNTLLYVSNYVQPVALSAIMIGSSRPSRGTEQRALEDHTALLEILVDVREELAALRMLQSRCASQMLPAVPEDRENAQAVSTGK